MENTFKQYHSELLSKLQALNAEIESNNGKVSKLLESRCEIRRQIGKVKEIINERNNTFLIKTKNGFITANSKYTNNINLAYTYTEDEAVRLARKLGGWLETLPE